MISRRLLRVKALQVIYAFNRKEGDDLVAAERELEVSIGKAYDLYLYLLMLLTELRAVASGKIETGLNKKMPSWDDLNPNRKFADNFVIDCIEASKQLQSAVAGHGLSWSGSAEIPRGLYNKMTGWVEFTEYLASQDNTPGNHKKFIAGLLYRFLAESDDLLLHLEERSIYWNDDLEFALIMIEKSIRKSKPGGEIELIPLYKNEDDEKFAFHLMQNTLLKSEVTRGLIDANTTNWEIERIALMDILVMQLAITEIMVFPEIPVKVTLNEYIEIAKHYCTSKSSTFINGILDKVVKEMKEKEMFEKSGRGLVGDGKEEKTE